MNRWMTYIEERVSLLSLSLLTGGISLSGIFLERHQFRFLSFIVAFIGIFLFFSLQLLMNDIKNLNKDRIAFKQRPLPRGLILKKEAERSIIFFEGLLFAYSLLLWTLISVEASLSFFVLTVCLWLNYKNFYRGSWLANHPILEGILQQLIFFPLALFAVSLANEDAFGVPSTWSFALMLFGAFSCFEICRILNPHSHPVLATYVHFYGFRRTFEFAIFMIALSAMGAVYLGLTSFLLPVELTVVVCLSLIFFQPLWFKIPEMAAGLSLFCHTWSVVLNHYLNG